MLQQTQVKTVVPYYARFLAAFPTVEALAAAPLERVLKLWEGLGYYARARNLHRAAKRIVETSDGAPPRSAEAWRELPGVGPYTANAIASITTGEPVAVLDGNVKRVLARLLAIERSIDEPQTITALWQAADNLLDRESPGDFNQAMMELGARICTPRSPACLACPAAPWCQALATGRVDRLPVRRPRARTPEFHEQAAIISRRGRFLLVRRPAKGLLASLWGWPMVAVSSPRARSREIEDSIRERFGLAVECGPRLTTVRHDFTHRRLFVHVYRAVRVAGRLSRTMNTEARWVLAGELRSLPLSTLDHKIVAATATQRSGKLERGD